MRLPTQFTSLFKIQMHKGTSLSHSLSFSFPFWFVAFDLGRRFVSRRRTSKTKLVAAAAAVLAVSRNGDGQNDKIRKILFSKRQSSEAKTKGLQRYRKDIKWLDFTEKTLTRKGSKASD